MTDTELLMGAAKAAGLTVRLALVDGSLDVGADVAPWNPLVSDSDALRLAVTLQMDVFVRTDQWSEAVAPMVTAQREQHGTGNALAATRRAVVRAAAEVGRKS